MGMLRTGLLLTRTALLVFPLGAGAVPILSVDTDPAVAGIQPARTVALGASFDIELRIAGVEALSPLHAFELDLVSDSAVISASGVLDLGFLAPNVFVLEQDIAPPDVNFAETRTVEEGVAGEGVLLRVSYAALGLGTSALDLSNVILSAPRGVAILPFTLEDGSITVVPEPGTASLGAAGLVFLTVLRAGRGRRRA